MMEAGDNNDFPSNVEFVEEEVKPVPWRDVECNTVLEMMTVKHVQRA